MLLSHLGFYQRFQNSKGALILSRILKIFIALIHFSCGQNSAHVTHVINSEPRTATSHLFDNANTMAKCDVGVKESTFYEYMPVHG